MSVRLVLPVNPFVHSYLFLRRAIGLIGMALPVVLIAGVYAISGDLLTSISGYYYSDLRNVFVGSMCAIGVFLICYRGLDPLEDALSWVAGAAALGVAVFPTRPADSPTALDKAFGYVHLASAAVFFLTLAAFCLFLFPRNEKDPLPDPARKRVRNRVYLACGVAILACMVLTAVFGWLLEAQMRSARPVLWLEAIAVFAFGVSWLVKGQTLWRDAKRPQPRAMDAMAAPA
ncbi:DUF998 domain-containing protein [Actinocrispum wychmicini]|uniref:DUF998 domain-containing protein n=1 Tax=Actinocrispum wychmicini TaxID=1213861 RepID=A0A4R2JL24_9PSEU|nr:DUF998 domain-containing protein [Actinocrispum wychmicini]TCO54875.1 hypothetical protein EV192_108163 [Actinocrispum wychmicini]